MNRKNIDTNITNWAIYTNQFQFFFHSSSQWKDKHSLRMTSCIINCTKHNGKVIFFSITEQQKILRKISIIITISSKSHVFTSLLFFVSSSSSVSVMIRCCVSFNVIVVNQAIEISACAHAQHGCAIVPGAMKTQQHNKGTKDEVKTHKMLFILLLSFEIETKTRNLKFFFSYG